MGRNVELHNKYMRTLTIAFLFLAASCFGQTGSISVNENHTNHTIFNARWISRITSITSSATPTINTDNCDAVTITAQAANITSMTSGLTGTPNNFDKLIIRIKDLGGPWAITWGTSYASSQSTLPTTTAAGKVTTIGLMWNSVKAKWICLATDQEP